MYLGVKPVHSYLGWLKRPVLFFNSINQVVLKDCKIIAFNKGN